MKAFLVAMAILVLTGLAAGQAATGGIGVVFEGVAGGARVTAVVPGGPGERAGLRIGDLILAVDDRPLVTLGGEAIAGLIRGPIGAPVKLAIASPDGMGRTVTVVRGVLPQQGQAAVAPSPAAPEQARRQAVTPTPGSPAPEGTSVAFVRWVEPRERAFTIEVPRGWRVEGGVNWIGSVDPQTFVRAQSPDGRLRVFIGDPEILARQVPGPYTSMQTGGTPEGGIFRAPSGGPMMVQRFLTGAQFAKAHVAGRICQAPRWLREADLPVLSRETTEAFRADAQRANLMLSASAGEAGFACNDAIGYVTATTFQVQQPGIPIQGWAVLRVGGFTASDPLRAIEARYIAEHMMATMKNDPHWQQAVERKAIQATGSVLSVQNAALQNQLASSRKANETLARLNNPNQGLPRRAERADIPSISRSTRRMCDAIDRCQEVSTQHETMFMNHSGVAVPGRPGGAPPDNTGVWSQMK